MLYKALKHCFSDVAKRPPLANFNLAFDGGGFTSLNKEVLNLIEHLIGGCIHCANSP